MAPELLVLMSSLVPTGASLINREDAMSRRAWRPRPASVSSVSCQLAEISTGLGQGKKSQRYL
jgi:hypothetical protein